MVKLSYFERLIETVTLLVRHPEYPNKRGVLERSRFEVTELIRAGRLTVPEAETLFEILDTYPLIPAPVMSEVGHGCSTGASAAR
jgi:hypothetical protein